MCIQWTRALLSFATVVRHVVDLEMNLRQVAKVRLTELAKPRRQSAVGYLAGLQLKNTSSQAIKNCFSLP